MRRASERVCDKLWHITMCISRFVRDRKQNSVPAFNTVRHNSRLTSTLHVVFVVTNAKQLLITHNVHQIASPRW